MKNKLFVFILAMFICNSLVFAQNNMSIGIDDNIYRVLDSAQARGLCDFLPTVKPYSLKRIKYAIDQILENQEKLTVVERQIIENFLDKIYNKFIKILLTRILGFAITDIREGEMPR